MPRRGGAPAAMSARRGALALAVLAVLVAPAMPVPSDGGGDYPPPASGDWVITQDTWVANETIYLGGNLTVSGANLALEKVTVIGEATGTGTTVTIEPGSSLMAGNCTFLNGPGSWIWFDILGTSDVHDCVFGTEPDNITITFEGGPSRLVDSTVEGGIYVESPPAPELSGTVIKNGGRLVARSNVSISGITVINSTVGAEGMSKSTFSDCTFQYCIGALYLGSDSSASDCTFRNCSAGIIGPNAPQNQTIRDCAFYDCGWGILTGFMTIDRCRFENCSEGVRMDRSSTVRDCTFEDCNISVHAYDAADIAGCSFEGDGGTGIKWREDSINVSDSVFMFSNGSGINGTGPAINITDSHFSGGGQALNLTIGGQGAVTRCTFERFGGNSKSTPYVELAGRTLLRDSRFPGGTGRLLLFRAGASRSVNVTVPGMVEIAEGASVEVAWYLDTTILYPNGTPAEGARLTISNRSGIVLSTPVAGPDGRTPRQEVNQYLWEWNRTTFFTPISLNASKDGLAANLSVNLNQNMDLSLTLGDVNAPSVQFTAPQNNSLQNRTTCLFTGTASDDQGVASVRLRTGSGAWVTANGTSEWMATLELAEGTNQVTAEVSDEGGNTARALLTVRVDTVAPVVEITHPPPGLLVNATAIELTGRTEPGCTVLVDGEAVPFYLGQFSAEVALQEGRNDITVTARDAAGNTGRAFINITRDTIPPALTLSSPQNGQVTGSAVVTVSGTTEPGARVFVDGTELAPEGPFFSMDGILSEGVNTIDVGARDAAGNFAHVSVRVILDSTPPAITVGLRNGTIVHSSVLVLGGSTEPGASLSVNGAPVAVASDGNFSAEVPLLPGRNDIRIEASDPAGNTAALDRTVTFEELPTAPRPPAVPEDGQAFYLGLAIGILVVAIIIGVFMAFYVMRRPPPPARDDDRSGSIPAGRGP